MPASVAIKVIGRCPHRKIRNFLTLLEQNEIEYLFRDDKTVRNMIKRLRYGFKNEFALLKACMYRLRGISTISILSVASNLNTN